MKTRLLSLGRMGSVGRRLLGVLGLTHRAGGARFAEGATPQPAPSEPAPGTPAPAANAPGAGEHAVHHHPPHKPHRNTTLIIVGLATVGVIVVFVAAVVVMWSSRPTYDQLETKLTTAAANGTRVYAVLTPEEFLKVAKVDRKVEDSLDISFYYTLKSGTVEVVVDRAAWGRNQARIKKMTRLP